MVTSLTNGIVLIKCYCVARSNTISFRKQCRAQAPACGDSGKLDAVEKLEIYTFRWSYAHIIEAVFRASHGDDTGVNYEAVRSPAKQPCMQREGKRNCPSVGLSRCPLVYLSAFLGRR